MVLTSTEGQENLPRYFARVFDIAQKLDHGRIDIHLPDGRVFRAEGPNPGPVAEAHIHNTDCFARLIRDGDLGFCEAYVDGWWTTPDLLAFFDFMHADNAALFDGFPGFALVRAYEKLRFWMHSNTRSQARRNIAAHYDLGNAFYGLWLDETMTYSSALFETGQESLEAAQTKKYASMVDQMGTKPGDHVLEIGCGWGGFAEYAAKERGLHVTGLTISREQFDFAQERIRKAGLQDQVTFKLQDYRDERGTYDGIASIEMFEAVGERYWPTYWQTVRDRLKPGRTGTFQIITVQDERWELYRRSRDFIQKYIFPGGMLPSPGKLREEIDRAGLALKRKIDFAESYSITLRRWHETFNEQWDEIARLGFDERFRRMWNVYLTSCAATFHRHNCDVTQITVERPA
ncbi:SAM-dependent methyltransferase [Histidinibacterium aquaticum]|uniref:Class I SAM-dependent methyltransferase n=1 Tax=Histidinibacterium aquaticum TaxID=2613962 RepID=A0A5J5GP46_9RHOB|nr:cyclopropane-fatty-acyl-phospholipid synthase family protein [Histidinibacterium aquaticum]KAA9009825.1 class I SAM-dependent methyltransferase [Histidinibacterium aquaticum]